MTFNFVMLIISGAMVLLSLSWLFFKAARTHWNVQREVSRALQEIKAGNEHDDDPEFRAGLQRLRRALDLLDGGNEK